RHGDEALTAHPDAMRRSEADHVAVEDRSVHGPIKWSSARSGRAAQERQSQNTCDDLFHGSSLSCSPTKTGRRSPSISSTSVKSVGRTMREEPCTKPELCFFLPFIW